MKTKIGLFLISIFALSACGGNPDNSHSSQNSLDWDGTYRNVTITGDDKHEDVVVLTINKDLTYTMQSACSHSINTPKLSSGKFAWNKAGNEITLIDTSTKVKTTYKVGENNLRAVSKDSNAPVVRFDKVDNTSIIEKYWRLIELNGTPIASGITFLKEPHIILKNEDNRIFGSGGCNSVFGGYTITGQNGISFTQMAGTRMAGPEEIMKIEDDFLKVLGNVDNYTLSADGKFLSLNRARMAPLARFEVVYLR